jgi:beta-lactamase superfamily II metal-dependent hydrolase
MVLSHSDSDHLGAVDEICDAYHVKRILRSGYQRSTSPWTAADTAIRAEADKDGDACIHINLRYFEYPMGATYRYGDVYVTMVCGFHKPPADWGSLSQSKKRNAGSIIIRLLYKGKSVLFCGDACIATEDYMVEDSHVIPIDSDVLIAPHHGSHEASSTNFIRAVDPQYVVFSAGRKHDHPRAVAAQRYLDYGISADKMLRTDRGDDEGPAEWAHERIEGHKDKAGDDDVDILIRSDGSVGVEYRNAQ